jgi:uncharacterized protein (TIGR02594 family)
MIKPSWLVKAYAHEGLTEVPGKENNPTIVKWLTELKAWWKDDLTPWCGTFMAHCFGGYPLPKHWYRAKDWLNWGIALENPAYGCIVVFNRAGGGHVGLVTGVDQLGRLLVIGGNQKDKVSVAPFNRDRVAGYRWPVSNLKPNYKLPVINSDDKSSNNEA